MEIESELNADRFTFVLNGRLDADWSAHVDAAFDAAIQQGHHQLDVDLKNVDYISSAGIGVLIKYHKKLASIKGQLLVLNASGEVLAILRLMKLTWLMPGADPPAANETKSPRPESAGFAGFRIECYQLTKSEPMTCRLYGNPDLFAGGHLSDVRPHAVKFLQNTIGLGLGAFGNVALDHRSSSAAARFGESLAVAGAVVQHATNGSRIPDYQLSFEALVPELQLLYGIQCEGDFSSLIRFEATEGSTGTVSFSKLIHEALTLQKLTTAAFVIVAESLSVVGARLIQSPASVANGVPLEFPGIRDWLTFSSEQERDPQLLLIVGLASLDADGTGAIRTFLRPMTATEVPAGHFHAAQFRYSPLPRGMVDLHGTVRNLFNDSPPQSVWHLLQDDRPFEGAGETELMRGACWCGPVTEIIHVRDTGS